VQVRNLNMGELLAASPATRGKLSGTGELNLQLFGSLDNDWQKSLSGTGQLAIRDGRLPGINLTGALESATKLAGMSGETPFSVIQADLTIGQRRISSRQIHVDSPHGTVDLHGSCSLDGALEYDGQAVWTPGAAAGGQGAAGAVGAILGGVLRRDIQSVTVPIAIRGTLQDPKFYPGRGAPRIQSPSPQPGLTPPQKDKSILDIFRRP
jgi:AsmA protein